MRIAVTTPSGHVGSAVADFLLDFGGEIRVKLLCRRPDKVKHFVARGAETAVGTQDDADYLVKATRDVDTLFWVTPPGYGSDNLRAFQNRLGKAAAVAVRTNKIRRVVNLSSIGAHLDAGVGPVNGLHDVEKLFDETGADITHLRPGFFFENLLWHLDSIRKSGQISLPLPASQRYAMIATRDIGRVAAERSASPRWSGRQIRELHGPVDLTYGEVARILSEALGRKILYVESEPEEARRFMLESAMSENAAGLMLELYDAAKNGRLRPVQARTPETTTTTTLAEFAREIMLPMLAQPVTRH